MRMRAFAPEDESRAQRIYEESFPPAIRAPWDQVRDHRADEQLLVLIDPDDMVVGLSLIRHLGDNRMTFVRYLVVDSERRGAGLGGRLLTSLCNHVISEGDDVLLLDVEKPIGEHADEDRRRIEFYHRHGLTLLDVPDYAPPAHGESGEPVPLVLMGRVLGDGPPLVGAALQDAVAAVMLHRYDVRG